MLCVTCYENYSPFYSSESLDRVGRRETYLKNNFESLGEQNDNQNNLDMTVVSAETEDVSSLNKTNMSSLTSKFLTKTNSNADMISALKATQRDPEAVRKREELQRRIEETRRKLQSVRIFKNLFIFLNLIQLTITKKTKKTQQLEKLCVPTIRFSSSHFSTFFTVPLAPFAAILK